MGVIFTSQPYALTAVPAPTQYRWLQPNESELKTTCLQLVAVLCQSKQLDRYFGVGSAMITLSAGTMDLGQRSDLMSRKSGKGSACVSGRAKD